MQRRDYMKTVGGIVGGTAIGAGGLAAMTGGAAAEGDTGISEPETIAVTTDDGEIQFVGFGGHLRYEWDGLDTPAQYGEYEVEGRLRGDQFDDGATGWRSFGAQSGELSGEEDPKWGGDNDPDSGPGTEGYFEFRYGSRYDQRDYAVAYNDDVAESANERNITSEYGQHGLILVSEDDAFELRHFESDVDGEMNETILELKFTCRVYDGDPEGDGSQVGVTDSASADMTVQVENRPATGETGGRLDGTVGADES